MTNRCVAGFTIILSLSLLIIPTSSFSYEISIDVSPNVLNIQSQGTVVTIHTDINYSDVNVYSVHLNGILIKSWKADNRGNFVVKFLMEEVKQLDGLIIGDYNTLNLIGLTTYNDSFSGEQDIKVIDIVPKGK
jgi:hypothetical protein